MILHQVAQAADDLDRAVAFYTEVLGQEPVALYDPPGLAFFDLDGTRLMIEVGSPGSLLYLRVDDVRARVEELRSLGVTVEEEAHEVFADDAGTFGPPGGSEWIALIRDSEGNLLGLATRYPAG